MSEAVERRVLHLLQHPTTSPYGNPIPGLEELDKKNTTDPSLGEELKGLISLNDFRRAPDGASAVVHRIGEPIQADLRLMHALRRAGVQPGAVVQVTPSPDGVMVANAQGAAELPARAAAHVFVTAH